MSKNLNNIELSINESRASDLIEAKLMIENSNKQKLIANEQKDIIDIQVEWRKYSELKFYGFVALCILTGGFLFVICSLYEDIKLLFTSDICTAIDADVAVLRNENNPSDVKISIVQQVEVENVVILSMEFFGTRFIAKSNNDFQVSKIPDIPDSFSSYLNLSNNSFESGGISRDMMRSLYGNNVMNLPESTFLQVLLKTILHPFYLFQYFAVAVWAFEDYLVYAGVILFITCGAVYLTTAETLFNLQRLRLLAGSNGSVELLLPNGEFRTIADSELVPGDRFAVKEGSVMPCDAILLSGRVTIDESMLTGESVPVTKTPLELNSNTDDLSKRTGNIMFGGTKVLSLTREEYFSGKCIGLVYRTSFRSTKGQLVAALLKPKDDFLGFFSDTLYVILFMFILCTALYIWSAAELRKHDAGWGSVCLKYLDSVTIAVPPAMTASLTVATGISIERLRRLNIFVSDTGRVNWAGMIGAACFDKTGTLTEERLHFRGISVADPKAIGDDISSLEISPESTNKSISDKCFELMATCQFLSLIDNVPRGDPLEVELLRASSYKLAISSELGGKMCAYYDGQSVTDGLHILRHFEFTSDKLRAGSLVRRSNKKLIYYCKGSPESILKMVKQDTVPKDIDNVLTGLAKRGLRVIALAYKEIDSSDSVALTATQAELENSMTYLGLAFLSNSLKPETVSTITQLRKAKIASNMITGDHIYTAIAIATECSLLRDDVLYIVDANPDKLNYVQILKYHQTDEVSNMTLSELLSLNKKEFVSPLHKSKSPEIGNIQIAVTGRGLEAVKTSFSHLLPELVRQAQVFARMKPSDKQFIVEELLHTPQDFIRSEQVSRNSDIEASHGLDVTVNRSTMAEYLDWQDDGSDRLFVLFCGDGANDMAALRAATVGVSLCEAETSVAAPVTSRLQTPGAVIDVLKEGRCSLITAYVLVSFNIMYALIQLFMGTMMYSYALEVGDYTYLIQDLFFTLVLALAIAASPPAEVLSVEIPPQRFFTRYFSFKLFSQLLIFPVFQVLALEAMRRQHWYHAYDSNGEPLSNTYAYETSVISTIGLSQVMIASIVSTIDEPFRQSWTRNIYHVGSLVLQGAFVLYQLFGRREYFLVHVLEIKPLPYEFALFVLLLIIANLIVSLLLNAFADKCLKISRA